jgi:hypothetical protein
MSLIQTLQLSSAAQRIDRIEVCEEFFAQKHPTLRHQKAKVLGFLPSVRRLITHSAYSAQLDAETLIGPSGVDLITSKAQIHQRMWAHHRPSTISDNFSLDEAARIWELHNAVPAEKALEAATQVRNIGFRAWPVQNEVDYHILYLQADDLDVTWSNYIKDYMPRADPQYEQMRYLVRLARNFIRFPDSSLIGNMFCQAYFELRFEETSHEVDQVRDSRGYAIEPWGPEITVVDDVDMFRDPSLLDEQGCRVYGNLPPIHTIDVPPVICNAEAFEEESVASEGDEERRRFYEDSEWQDDAEMEWL